MKLTRRTAVPVALVAVGAVVVSGFAMAYWTSLGGGTGSAGVGTDSGVTVVQDSTVSNLYPGGPAQALDFTITNSNATTAVQTTNVVIGFGSFNAGCSAADFVIVQPSKPSVGSPVEIAGGASAAFTSGGAGPTGLTGASIRMLNTASNQDGCKLETVNLTFSVS